MLLTALPPFLISIPIILFHNKLVKREYDLTNSMILIVSCCFYCLMFQQMQVIQQVFKCDTLASYFSQDFAISLGVLSNFFVMWYSARRCTLILECITEHIYMWLQIFEFKFFRCVTHKIGAGCENRTRARTLARSQATITSIPRNLLTDYLSHYTPSVKASFIVVRMVRLELTKFGF